MICCLRNLAANAASVLASDLVNRGTTFLVYALIARHLGAHAFGQVALALTLFHTFRVFAAGGLNTLVTRQVARDRGRTERCAVDGLLLVTASSLAATGLVFVFVRVMAYGHDTATLVLLLSIGLLPQGLTALCEGLFQAWEQMHLIAWVHVPANLAKAVLAWWMLSAGADVHHVVGLLLGTLLAEGAVALWLLLRRICRPRLRPDPRAALALARATAPFMGLDLAIVGWTSLQILLLSRLADETEVGLFQAAAQLMVPLVLLFQSVARTLFPVMCRLFQPGDRQLGQVCEAAIEGLLAVALPMAAACYFLAGPLLERVYGDPAFLAAGPVLRLVAWGLAFMVFTHVLGQVLLAGGREGLTLRIVLLNGLISLAFGLLLIGPYGIVGAAAATLLSRAADAVQHVLPARRLLPGLSLLRASWKPVAACACSGLWLAAASDRGLALSAGGAVAIYAASLLALVTWSLGGPVALRARLRELWGEGAPGDGRALAG